MSDSERFLPVAPAHPDHLGLAQTQRAKLLFGARGAASLRVKPSALPRLLLAMAICSPVGIGQAQEFNQDSNGVVRNSSTGIQSLSRLTVSDQAWAGHNLHETARFRQAAFKNCGLGPPEHPIEFTQHIE